MSIEAITDKLMDLSVHMNLFDELNDEHIVHVLYLQELHK